MFDIVTVELQTTTSKENKGTYLLSINDALAATCMPESSIDLYCKSRLYQTQHQLQP